MFSALMAVALDDFTIKIVDIDIKRVVRQFSGHRNRITDMVSLHDFIYFLHVCLMYSSRLAAFEQLPFLRNKSNVIILTLPGNFLLKRRLVWRLAPGYMKRGFQAKLSDLI